jgi:glutathione synthase/RimK-type ligase-like ATP-grasp enzyme
MSSAPGRLLVLGAGTAAAENLLASLRHGDPSLVVLGAHEDRFVLRHSGADGRHLLPPPRTRGFVRALRGLTRDRGIDLVIPTSDVHVQVLSLARRQLAGKVFLPGSTMVDLCRDKYALISVLRRRGLAAPETHRITGRKSIDRIFARLGGKGPLFCRPRTGTCSRGGAAVSSPEEAWSWIRIWETMQGIPARSFTLAEYLPGRQIACQSVWRRGRMVLANTFERVAYFGVDNIPSGVTSLASLAKTVVEPDVVALCRQAIGAASPRASGAFSVDVKEDAHGRPHVTEINAGRLFMGMTAFDRILKHNMTLTWVRLALGQDVGLAEEYDTVDGYYMVRDLDMPPGLFHSEELFEGIEEARA